MENPFDRLAKTLAEEVPRREALRRLGGGLAATMLASLGIGKAWGQSGTVDCGSACRGAVPGNDRDSLARRRACVSSCEDCQQNGGRVCSLSANGTVLCCSGASPVCCGSTCCASAALCCNQVICCPPEQPTCCGGSCVNTATDPSNCGACGNVCLGGQLPACCAGRCTDLATDDFNCGACGHQCDVAHHQHCFGGGCT
jgi:Stigma-specific protein, Stig1